MKYIILNIKSMYKIITSLFLQKPLQACRNQGYLDTLFKKSAL